MSSSSWSFDGNYAIRRAAFVQLRSCFIEIDGGLEKVVDDGSSDEIRPFLSLSFV
jgi:hypothetical protein